MDLIIRNLQIQISKLLAKFNFLSDRKNPKIFPQNP